MRWLKRLLVGLLALVTVAMVAVYLTPLDTYVPELERVLSRQLHEPVKIRQISIAMVPLPHLELQDVRLGGQEAIDIRSVDVEFDLPGLLSGHKVLQRVTVKDGTAHHALVRKLVDFLVNTPVTSQLMRMRELQFSGITLLVPEMTLAPAEGKLEFAQTGQLERAWFAMDEQKVTATLVTLPDWHFALALRAHGWTTPKFQQFPPIPLDDLQLEGVLGEHDLVAQNFAVASRGMRIAGSAKVELADGWQVQATLTQADAQLEQVMALLGKPLGLTGALSVKGELSGKASALSALKENFSFSGNVHINHATAHIVTELKHPLIFDQISAHVVVHPDRLELSSLEAKLYGGKLSGTAKINRKTTMLVADAAVTGIAMQPLVEALSNEVLFTGNMDSVAKLSMRLDAFKQFPKNLQLDGNFHLRDGVLSKVDLLQAASNPGKTNLKEGTTRFDDLTGLLNVDASGYHFKKLKITSGSLNADGKVNISPALQISGKLEVNIKGTAGLVSMPLVISGTLDKPVVRPSGSVLAGAAVGTAILGPGLGTAIGVKIGGFLNKLFGNDDDKSDNGKVEPKSPVTKKSTIKN
ncbi:MAG: AsmA family protein [Gallionella sp.]|nr:AsmA family protein [Gallionella sp.]